jgi:hypothetical protein
MNVTLAYENQRFVAQSLQIPRNTAMANEINKKLVVEKLPLSEVYKLISDYTKTIPNENVCTVFKSDKSMSSCSLSGAIFHQTIRDILIRYTFTYDTINGVTSYTISDSDLDKATKDAYGVPITITKNAADAIRLIL